MALADTVFDTANKIPLRVSIEGNVGCGKSTLIRHFKNFIDVDAKAVSI